MSAFFDRLNDVSSPRIGLGCMNLSHGYGQYVPEKEALQVLEEAFEMGYRHFDTATLYGGTANERLLGLALKTKRHQLLLASKCGMALDAETGNRVIDGRPNTLRRQCEESLKRLKTDHLDIYYLHRLDRNVAIEESVGAIGRLVEEGKVGAVGLSEISAETLRKGNAEYPIAAVQSEYSLWTRNPEIALKEVCLELGVALVAFSPLGRGFLTGLMEENTEFSTGDMRAGMPRFSKENLPNNLSLLTDFKALATRLEVSPAQLALAWLNAQGNHIIPIPGTRLVTHMRENLSAETIKLEDATVVQLNGMMLPNQVAGARYNDAQQADIDTEEFAG
ncbi:aldo/keto reductase [Halomonas qinghailakensis]|uniref:Aldo/keto reductase n=1 Tax=Halomonas qinghailakensis TaxID=2937790 RepID=A0AA46TRY7_9GAMM|nr:MULTISPECIES: aldo/keto reductase [Halomonas]UYO74462.1 aldo/keto reductase [Halomonas sp. ZZQ-149]